MTCTADRPQYSDAHRPLASRLNLAIEAELLELEARVRPSVVVRTVAMERAPVSWRADRRRS